MFAEILLERHRADEVDVVIGTPGGTLHGRAVVTSRNPFGITLAAAPGAAEDWSGSEAG